VSVDFRTAIRDALDDELTRDERVILFSEDVAAAGGVFQATRGLLEKHGEDRVFDTPISELALAAAAFGSAITGARPVIEMMFGDFFPLAMDSIVNQAAKYWFLSNEQASVPLVVRSAVGGGGRFGAIHSQIPAPWFMSVAGLKIVCPATAADAKALLVSAIRDENPVLFLEHKRLYGLKDDGLPGDGAIGRARIARSGRDVTVVSAMAGVHESLAAADVLAADGIDCEVIDLRTLRPLDIGTIVESVAKTGNLVVVEEGPRTGGWSADVVTRVVEELPQGAARIWRLTTPDLPLPFAGSLEDAFLPGRTAIAESVAEHLRGAP
jgi:pyruvate/2-oxoglutarate/acetoin dehydrogenase E1 component